jgi:hypothetical protein
MDATWDQSKFDEALERYVTTSKRSLPVILNSKAFFVARKACWYTDRAERKELIKPRQPTESRHRSPTGGGLLLGAMISKRRGIGKGLYGPPMKERFDNTIASRRRSVGFIKSGWIPAIQALDPKAEDKAQAAPVVRGMRQYGVPKGQGQTASENRPLAVIVNSAESRSAPHGSAYRVGFYGLNRAFSSETESMEEYMEKKLAKAAAEANRGLA